MANLANITEQSDNNDQTEESVRAADNLKAESSYRQVPSTPTVYNQNAQIN